MDSPIRLGSYYQRNVIKSLRNVVYIRNFLSRNDGR